MHDHWLIAIALTISAVGIIGLLYALLVLQPELQLPDELADGAMTRMQGFVRHISDRGNITVVQLRTEVTIDAVVFDRVNLSEGDCVVLRGKKSTYEKKPQLVVSRITRCE